MLRLTPRLYFRLEELVLKVFRVLKDLPVFKVTKELREIKVLKDLLELKVK